MLEIRDASKTITLASGRQMQVLRDVSLQVEAGESLAILGRSGSGKSTLLGLLGLLDAPDTGGSYRVDGRETVGLSDREMAALRGSVFGFIYQRFCLMAHLTARENVDAPLRHSRMTRAERRSTVLQALDRVGLAERAHHRPEQLSGGEQQRVAIARALVRAPRVILADEPTGSLDMETGREVLALMTQLVAASKVSLVVVTHDLEIAMRLGRVVSIADGQIEDWKPGDKRSGHSMAGSACALGA
jgi:putative ABC transport system ATP-binding protein